MSWFRRDKPTGENLPKVENGERRVRTEGLWQKCEGCRQIIWKKDLAANWSVCPKCGWHSRIDALTRLKLLIDDGEFEEFDVDLCSSDPLGFVDAKPYSERLAGMQRATNMSDALISAAGCLAGRPDTPRRKSARRTCWWPAACLPAARCTAWRPRSPTGRRNTDRRRILQTRRRRSAA